MPAKKTEITATTKPSDTAAVDAYMAALDHPMKAIAEELRQLILATHKTVGEEIYWNAPCFYYTGEMQPFKPKELKRYIVGFNFFRKDTIRLIFLRGASVDDGSGFLEGDYADGRRLAYFRSSEDVKKKKKVLQKTVKELLQKIEP